MSTAGFLGSSPGASTAQAFSLAVVDPGAVKTVQCPGQPKHDRTLRLELDYNSRGTPFKIVAVLSESGQGKRC